MVALFIKTGILIVIEHHRRETEELYLSAMGMTTQRQLTPSIGQDMASPGTGIMLQHHHESIVLHTI